MCRWPHVYKLYSSHECIDFFYNDFLSLGGRLCLCGERVDQQPLQHRNEAVALIVGCPNDLARLAWEKLCNKALRCIRSFTHSPPR